ncbi:hypothetical protein EDC04DRAFT_2611472 [Pisolithus marmoratus]|nr:hypothetical protein EDC04DRAFT_2611472 [Pisolithus marmoratus]
MPLDSQPPPSPHGKVLNPKHCCLSTEPCPIRLSDVGKRYHAFPKGTFKARFIPLIFPKFILRHFASHPPVWTWTTKDGPNKGKSFQVPTIPIVCEKTAPCTVHWVVVVFHSFKTHLHPITIDTDSGKVHQGWLHLYQNNLHPPQPPPSTASSKEDSDEESTHDPPPPPSYTLKKIEDNVIKAFVNPPHWLVSFLTTPNIPTCFTSRLSVVSLLSLGSLLGDALEAVKLKFGGSSPFYVGVSQNGLLTISAMADCGLVTQMFAYPSNPSIPTAHH